MRKFLCRPDRDIEVDLDDPETYKHLPKTESELDDKMFCEIGKALVYMDHFHPDIFSRRKARPKMVEARKMWPDSKSRKKIDVRNSGWYQRQRVYKLIEAFAKNRRSSWGNIQWFREQVFMFEDETENMC